MNESETNGNGKHNGTSLVDRPRVEPAHAGGGRRARDGHRPLERLARGAGYELGFGGVRGGDTPLALPRVPVYLWDAGDVPLGLRGDRLGALGRSLAHVANRCAVGTSWMLGLTGDPRP